jgi:hypothetical protein
LVAGSGRRYIESVEVSLQPYGFWTLTTLNRALAGRVKAMRISPLLRRLPAWLRISAGT